jgi:Fe-S-cluster-containing hydrogenase component 2
MDGCPVDAIHRKGSRLEMQVEAHCIGCGLCERNCPYGSIHMVPKTGTDALRVANPPRRAVNCDLCGPVGGEPYCVSACPHDTAFRMTGEALMDEVLARMTSRSS